MKIFSFSKTYQNRTVLSFPEFELTEGNIYAVIGANGSGKSTFAKILSGTISPDQTRQEIFSPCVSVGYLPQKPYSFHMSVKKNILLNADPGVSDTDQRLCSLLDTLQLTHLANQKASSLSGGETSRMVLARLMMKDYPVLILDEPCAAMDIASTLHTEQLLRTYCKKNGTILILITHSLAQSRRIADNILFFHQGMLLEHGSAGQILSQPTKEETRQFLEFYL